MTLVKPNSTRKFLEKQVMKNSQVEKSKTLIKMKPLLFEAVSQKNGFVCEFFSNVIITIKLYFYTALVYVKSSVFYHNVRIFSLFLKKNRFFGDFLRFRKIKKKTMT